MWPLSCRNPNGNARVPASHLRLTPPLELSGCTCRHLARRGKRVLSVPHNSWLRNRHLASALSRLWTMITVLPSGTLQKPPAAVCESTSAVIAYSWIHCSQGRVLPSPWSGRDRQLPQPRMMIPRPIPMTPDARLSAQALTGPTFIPGPWRVPSMLPVAGLLLNIAAVSLSTAVDGFYVSFWTTAGLRGTSIMGGGLSRIW